MTYLKCSQDDSSGVTAWHGIGNSAINTAYTTDSTPLCVQVSTCKKTELVACEYTPSGGRKIIIDHGRTVKLDTCNTCTCNDGTATCTEKTCQSCTKAALETVMTNKKLMYYSAIYEKYVLDNNSPGRTFLLKCKDGFNHQAETTDTGKRRLGVAWSTSDYAASRFYVRCSADGSWAETVSNCIGKQESCTGSDGKVVAHGGKLYKDCHSWCVHSFLFPLL